MTVSLRHFGAVLVLGFGWIGCRDGSSPFSPYAPAFTQSEEIPSVTQEQWDSASVLFDITDFGVNPRAIGYGQTAPYYATLEVWTGGRVILPFIPSVRHDVVWTLKIGGSTYTDMIAAPYVWESDGFHMDFIDFYDLKCHVSSHESISAFSSHWARWRAVGLIWETGPERFPKEGTVTDKCPPPECPEPSEPDGDGEGCVEPELQEIVADEDCTWYKYTYWEWSYATQQWVEIYYWYQCEFN